MAGQWLERWKDHFLEALVGYSLQERVRTGLGCAYPRPGKEASCDLGKEVYIKLWTCFTCAGWVMWSKKTKEGTGARARLGALSLYEETGRNRGEAGARETQTGRGWREKEWHQVPASRGTARWAPNARMLLGPIAHHACHFFVLHTQISSCHYFEQVQNQNLFCYLAATQPPTPVSSRCCWVGKRIQDDLTLISVSWVLYVC